jgi:hypothetical protein
LVTFFWRSKRKSLAAGRLPASALQSGMRLDQRTSPGFDKLSPNGRRNAPASTGSARTVGRCVRLRQPQPERLRVAPCLRQAQPERASASTPVRQVPAEQMSAKRRPINETDREKTKEKLIAIINIASSPRQTSARAPKHLKPAPTPSSPTPSPGSHAASPPDCVPPASRRNRPCPPRTAPTAHPASSRRAPPAQCSPPA